MSKSIPLYIDNELEEMIKIILEETDDFETGASLLRICTKKYLKNNYPELLLKSFEND